MIKHGGINILMMDEIDGGSLDQQACISIVNSLYEVCSNDTILVITHNELVSQRIKDQITVTKECGFSAIS
jgi:DNA repair exonuclease SbcCD ATPase subunit